MRYLNQTRKNLRKSKDKYSEWLESSDIWSDIGFVNLRNYMYKHIYKQPIVQDLIKYVYRNIYWSKMRGNFLDKVMYLYSKLKGRWRSQFLYWMFLIFWIFFKILGWLLGGWLTFLVIFGCVAGYLILWSNYNLLYKRLSLKGRVLRNLRHRIRWRKSKNHLFQKALRKKFVLQKEYKVFNLSEKYAKRNWFLGRTTFQEHQYVSPKLLHWLDVVNLYSPKSIFFFNSSSLILKHHISIYKKSFVIDPIAKTQEDQLFLKHYLESNDKLKEIENELRAQKVIRSDGVLKIKPIYSKQCLYDHRNNTQVILSCYALIFISHKGTQETVLALGPWYVNEFSKKPWYVTIDLQIYREAIKANYKIGFDIDAHLTLTHPRKFKFGEHGHSWIRGLPITYKIGPFVRRRRKKLTDTKKFFRIIRLYNRRRKEQFLDFVNWKWYYFYYTKINTPRKREFVRFMTQLTARRKVPMGYIRQLKILISKIRGYWVHFNTVYMNYVKRRLRWYNLEILPLKWKHYWIRIGLDLDWWWFDFWRDWPRIWDRYIWGHVKFKIALRYEIKKYRVMYNYELLWEKGWLRKAFNKKFKPWLMWRICQLIPKIFKEVSRLFPIVLLHMFYYIKKTLISIWNLKKMKSSQVKINNLVGKKFFFFKINLQRSAFIRKVEDDLNTLSIVPRTHFINAIDSDLAFREEIILLNAQANSDVPESKTLFYDNRISFLMYRMARWPYTNWSQYVRLMRDRSSLLSMKSMQDRCSLRHFVYRSELKKIHINYDILDDASLKLHGVLQQIDFLHLIPSNSVYNELAMTHIDDIFFGLTQFYNENSSTWATSDKYLQNLFLYYHQSSAYPLIFYKQTLLKSHLKFEIKDIVCLQKQYLNNINLTQINKKIKVRIKRKNKQKSTLNPSEVQNFNRVKNKVNLLLKKFFI